MEGVNVDVIEDYINAWYSLSDFFDKEDSQDIFWQSIDSLGNALRLVSEKGVMPMYLSGVYGVFVMLLDKCLHDYAVRGFGGLSRLDQEKARVKELDVLRSRITMNEDCLAVQKASGGGFKDRKAVIEFQYREVRKLVKEKVEAYFAGKESKQGILQWAIRQAKVISEGKGIDGIKVAKDSGLREIDITKGYYSRLRRWLIRDQVWPVRKHT